MRMLLSEDGRYLIVNNYWFYFLVEQLLLWISLWMLFDFCLSLELKPVLSLADDMQVVVGASFLASARALPLGQNGGDLLSAASSLVELAFTVAPPESYCFVALHRSPIILISPMMFPASRRQLHL